MAYRSVPARVAAVLLRLSHENKNEYESESEQPIQPIQITHQELGDMVGALRESVTKVLDDFQRTGFVELSRGHIQVRKSKDLGQLLHE